MFSLGSRIANPIAKLFGSGAPKLCCAASDRGVQQFTVVVYQCEQDKLFLIRLVFQAIHKATNLELGQCEQRILVTASINGDSLILGCTHAMHTVRHG